MDNSVKQRIIEFNNQFGIKTEFIKDESVLGYAIGNTIYINENIEQDYERTNKHELLHFFENSEEFNKIKERLFEENKEKIDEIRGEYELRYFGLYSEEEIKAGVLDNEIAIDMMVDNSSFEYEDGLKIGDEFLGQIQKEIEEKRYLNITLKNNIKNMNLSDWEKIFVLNYYDGKERQLPQGKDKLQLIRADIEKYLDELYNIGKSEMIIDPKSPEVIREYESEIKALKVRGEDTSRLESQPELGYQEIADKMSNQLYEEYKHIVDLMKGLELEPGFKSMMLRETLTKVYKLDRDGESNERKTIVKNRKLNESISGHMILNETTLDFINKNIKDINEYQNFANLYFAAVEVYNKTISQRSEITLDGVDTYGKGKWLKFEGKRNYNYDARDEDYDARDEDYDKWDEDDYIDDRNYIENSKKLAALVQDTPWCTKTLASSQLAEGDFYVFVDNDEKPHIAVKMSGNEIDEVRGILNGNAQELEEEYRDVAISFLENNKNIENGMKWLEKEEWNKRFIKYRERIENGELTPEEIPFLLEDYFRADYKSHGGENTNKTALKKILHKAGKIFAEYYKCSEDEIFFDDIYFSNTDITKVPYRIILGHADFSFSEIESLGQLQSIGGYADFKDSKITSLGQLQSIGGYADFEDSKITSLGQLQSIGRGAYFGGSQITDLGQLQSIGGDADFKNSQIIDLGQLQSIGGYAGFKDSKITSLGQLQSIGRNAVFRRSQITSLGQLQSIGGDAYFSGSQITDLGQLQSIGRDAYFSGSQITDLGQLQKIGGKILDSEELKKKWKEIQNSREARISGQDIGKAGFGADVVDCDNADNFINTELEKNSEKEGEYDE